MGPQKWTRGRGFTFCKKLPPEQGAISAQNIKNHQKSSLFEFAVERRSLRDPKTAPRRVPVSAALYRECENGRPEGPPSSQHSGREAFFLTFSRAKKRRFSHSRYTAGPKIPPGRDPRRPEFPICIRAEASFWDPKNRREGRDSFFAKSFPQSRDRSPRKTSKIIKNHHFSNLR